jgi:hypothetical protein
VLQLQCNPNERFNSGDTYAQLPSPKLSAYECQTLVKAALRRRYNGISTLTGSLILMIFAMVGFWTVDDLFVRFDLVPFYFIISLFYHT